MPDRNEKLRTEQRESKEIEREALALGIEIPNKPNWWLDDVEEQMAAGASKEDLQYVATYWLSPQGKAGAKWLIREELERIKDRKIKRATEIIAAVTGLAGAMIGILAIILSMIRN